MQTFTPWRLAAPLLSLGWLAWPAAAEVNDYLLFEAPGLTVRSTFARHGEDWCKHVYVAVVADYDSPAGRAHLLAPNYATFIKQTVLPKIQVICPGFPADLKFSRQVLHFQVRERGAEYPRERLGFEFLDNGSVALIDDYAAAKWRTANADHTAITPPRNVDVATGALTGIDNPNGWHMITINGAILRLKVERERHRDGSYSVQGYQVDSGKRTMVGTWYPRYQQFHAREWMVVAENPQCSQLSERRWSNEVQPAEYPAGDRSIAIFEETTKHAPERSPRICVVARMNPGTCEIQSCSRYAALPARFVLVQTRADADVISPVMARRYEQRCRFEGKSEGMASLCGRW